MTEHTIWRDYTTEVLAWRLGEPLPAVASASPRVDTEALAVRLLRMVKASGRPLLALLGLGDGTLAARLLDSLPAGVRLLVLESNPHRARAVLPHFPELGPCLLVDTSPWALLLLALEAGLTPDNCTLGRTSPDMPPQEAAEGSHALQDDQRVLHHWRQLFFGARRQELPPASPATVRISVGAILHPAEPRLNEFFAHIPPWVHEVCVIWDGKSPGFGMHRCPAPLLARVRPLGGNFGEQRNVMLDLCSGDWCLYLDADERLHPQTWAALPALAALAGAGGVLFPRLTFEGSEAHVRMGYGLWPDVQCRFFPLQGQARFHGTIHEQIRGLGGNRVLTPGMPILHYSHVRKKRTQVEEKLRIFNEAAGSEMHVASESYPCLPRSVMETVGASFGCQSVLWLPAVM